MRELRLDFGNRKQAALLELSRDPQTPLRVFLTLFPARSSEAPPPDWLDLPVSAFVLTTVKLPQSAVNALPPATSTETEPNTANELPLDGADTTGSTGDKRLIPTNIRNSIVRLYQEETMNKPQLTEPDSPFPERLSDYDAVRLAYSTDIKRIAQYLLSDLSVLVVCDKALVEHLYREIVRRSEKEAVTEDLPTTFVQDGDSERQERRSLGGLLPREGFSITNRIATIGRLLTTLKPGQMLVLRHLDVLAGCGVEGRLTPEARLLTEVLYRSGTWTPTILGFIDPSLGLPRVLSDRFAVRVELAGLRRETIPYLVTRAERACFDPFDQELLFKNVSGFNVLQLRNTMRYLWTTNPARNPTPAMMQRIREFKRGGSEGVSIPDVTFDQIGGYAYVKAQLFEAIELITGRPVRYHPDGTARDPAELLYPEESAQARAIRRKLAPRGFIFYGPPGTGKTLFAKAVANEMNATIQTVSGPEIMDMWVGRSESNLRRLFALARKNAPSVIFFDEFDSIAGQRGAIADGASRASNAVVAQLLTEIDGFRDDQDILVIGTTNRMDMIDQALLRPSRFQPVEIGLPDAKERRQIACIHANHFAITPPDKFLFDMIASNTEGCSGDEIHAIFQHVARRARRGEPITTGMFRTQIDVMKQRCLARNRGGG
jgi:transitional endoplasmic reticulum ATPase